jgi:hypothetical protein
MRVAADRTGCHDVSSQNIEHLLDIQQSVNVLNPLIQNVIFPTLSPVVEKSRDEMWTVHHPVAESELKHIVAV